MGMAAFLTSHSMLVVLRPSIVLSLVAVQHEATHMPFAGRFPCGSTTTSLESTRSRLGYAKLTCLLIGLHGLGQADCNLVRYGTHGYEKVTHLLKQDGYGYAIFVLTLECPTQL